MASSTSVSSASHLPILMESLASLRSLKKSLTTTESRYAEEVIQALHIIEENKAELATILDENKRNQTITDLTHLIAETGLFPGDTPSTILASIDIRIQAFVKTFLHEKEHGELINFFREGFIGPPCFNGRLITSESYGFSKHGEKHRLFFEHHTSLDRDAVKLEDFMYVYSAAMNTDPSVPSLESLRNYFKITTGEYLEVGSLFCSDHIDAIYARACQFYIG